MQKHEQQNQKIKRGRKVAPLRGREGRQHHTKGDGKTLTPPKVGGKQSSTTKRSKKKQ